MMKSFSKNIIRLYNNQDYQQIKNNRLKLIFLEHLVQPGISIKIKTKKVLNLC